MMIREAEFQDAYSIGIVHVESWKTTYKNIIPDDFLDNMSYERRSDKWKDNIAQNDQYVFVAENDDGEIVGFADCGKRDENTTENAGDLTSIYLLEAYQGRGIGKELFKQLFFKFNELGYNRVFVEVLEGNDACRFYEHYGAKQIKSEQVKIGGAELNLLTYEWEDVDDVISKLT
ncbi:GNAT family N-acetyltransferase [Alkalibacillus almallahensis]|uniref:GNAT family N-acetyltransferase n=1 Tax=Alkalibacillus almallahensis TaxID=1379154 RepID=UPI001422C8F9|nr:GNAT family N-acetyltransferase [Alkalibacillus almallahensis]NIK12602.1 GNAT superfamily N-acetyltransferase [Alkalibacillus almallahensis]